MSQHKKLNTPTSFTHFNQLDNPNFIQYLENYCAALQKKEKQTLEMTKKWNLFMEEEEQIDQGNQKIFQKNLSKPSINFFQFKDAVHSVQNFTKDFYIKEEYIQSSSEPNQCKEEALSQEIPNQDIKQRLICSKNQPQNTYKRQESIAKINKQEQARRISHIIKEVDFINTQIMNLMDYFCENILNN